MAVVGLALACGMVAAPASAHHSFGHYDMTKTAEIEGTVRKFEWSNPHCWLFVDVPSANGAPVTYGFELSSVGEMLRRGWKKTSLKTGGAVKVGFRPMRDGSPAGLLMSAADSAGKSIGLSIRGPGAAGPPPAAVPGAEAAR
jgi:hypothetical protein